MDIKKLFIQLMSVLLAMVLIVCIGTAIKRSGEPEKEYDFSEDTGWVDDWFTSETESGTEDTQVGSSEDNNSTEENNKPDNNALPKS